MAEITHFMVSRKGTGTIFAIDDDGRSYIEGFISAYDRSLVVRAWSCSKLTLVEVVACAEAWQLAVETVRLHEHCFLWKLEVESEECAFWYIWAPTAEVAHERMLGSFAAHPPADHVVSAAVKGTWVRA